MKEVIKIKLDKIVPNKSQPRLDFYDESIEGLADSIRENGLLQPITVRKVGSKYELIAGERRYRACCLLKKKDIDAIVLEKTDDESANLALVENLQREDLNAIEQALAMKRIMSQEDITQEELANRLGYKQSTVANKLRLLKLPEYIKSAVSQNIISERHARALLKVPEDRVEEVFMVITNRKYNVAKTEEYVKGITTEKVHRKGISSNVKIALNTFDQAFKMVRDAGIDGDMQTTEYEDQVKIVIKIKKLG